MYGSGAVAQQVFNTLKDRAPIIAAVDDRIYPLSVAPADTAFPMILHYMESGTYSGPLAGMEPEEEVVSYVVRIIDDEPTNKNIRAAAKDMLAALVIDNAQWEVTQGNETFAGAFIAAGEWPLTTVVDQDVIYSTLGIYLTCHVFKVS